MKRIIACIVVAASAGIACATAIPHPNLTAPALADVSRTEPSPLPTMPFSFSELIADIAQATETPMPIETPASTCNIAARVLEGDAELDAIPLKVDLKRRYTYTETRLGSAVAQHDYVKDIALRVLDPILSESRPTIRLITPKVSDLSK